MKSLYLALGFLVLLAIIAVGVWVSLMRPGGGEVGERTTGIFGSLFPFGSGGALQPSKGSDGDPQFPVGPVPKLRKVSDAAVAGAQFATGMTGIPSIRYIERDTGHVYETPLDALTALRATNTTIPGVHDARWVTASSAVLTLLGEGGTVEHYLGYFTATSTDQVLQGSFLKSYRRIAVEPNVDIVGVLEASNGAALETTRADGNDTRLLYTSPIVSWVPHAAGGKYFVASAPSGAANGTLYRIQNGAPTRVVGDISGLMVLPDERGERFLISGGAQNTSALFVYDGRGLTTLPLETLADKCGWVPNSDYIVCGIPQSLPPALYPDDWLLGRAATEDELWAINVADGTTTALVDLSEESGLRMDVCKVHVTENGAYALFVNKIDQTLWAADITLQ